jgi:hypothetical protein
MACTTACQSTSGGDEGGDRKTLADTSVAPGVEMVEQEAVDIVKAAAMAIVNAQSISVTAITGFDVIQGNGQKIEFGSQWKAHIQRPSRAHMRSVRRDGEITEITFDGNDLWMYSPTHEVYAFEPQPGDVDATFNHLLEELDVSTPLHNLFSSELGTGIGDDLIEAYVVGDSTIGERVCHHVAMRNDYSDYQIWIDKGDVPYLRRMVISYREEEGHPQYWVYFTEWNLDAQPAPGTFVFQPPAGAERIRLAHVGEE